MGEDCMLVGLLSCVGVPFGPVMRWRVRQDHGIRGSMTMDAVFWACLPCCSLIQEAREVDSLATTGPDSGAAGGKYEERAPTGQPMARS